MADVRGAHYLFGGFAAFVGACSLTTDLSGLSGDAAPVVTDVTDSGSPSPDAGGGDSGPPAEGGADAGTFCEQHPGHTWCEDFDRSTTVPVLDESNDAKGLVSIDSIASSPPHSLRVRYVPGDFVVANIAKRFQTGNKITFSLDIRADLQFESGQPLAFTINVPGGSNSKRQFFYVETFGGPLRFIESVDYDNGSTNYRGTDIEMSHTEGVFEHLDIVIDRLASHFTVELNGARVSDYDMLEGFAAGEMTITLGAFANGVEGGNPTFYLDNVLLDVQ